MQDTDLITIYRNKSIKVVNILRENTMWEEFYTCFCCWNESFPKKGKSTAAKWGQCSCRLCSMIIFRLSLRRIGHDWSSFKLWMHASTCSPATGVWTLNCFYSDSTTFFHSSFTCQETIPQPSNLQPSHYIEWPILAAIRDTNSSELKLMTRSQNRCSFNSSVWYSLLHNVGI